MKQGPSSKKFRVQGICVAAIILFVLAAAIIKSQTEFTGRRTTLVVKNSNQIDTITAYLTIGCPDTNKWQSNVAGIFGITTSGAQGSFTIAPNQQASYISIKAIQGNICFNSPPLNCPLKTTVCEFCLNNHGTIKNAQETVEISCVSGISFIANIKLSGHKWTANSPDYDTITTIQNGLLNTNSGRVGVYPFGCDDCTEATKQAPGCTIGKNESPQKHAICNVQRNAKFSGGSMVISFVKSVK